MIELIFLCLIEWVQENCVETPPITVEKIYDKETTEYLINLLSSLLK